MDSSNEEIGVCRVCTLSSDCFEYVNIFEKTIFKNVLVYEALHLITDLEIHKDDNLTPNLCTRCEQRLLEAYHFRKLAESSAKHFLNQSNTEAEAVKKSSPTSSSGDRKRSSHRSGQKDRTNYKKIKSRLSNGHAVEEPEAKESPTTEEVAQKILNFDHSIIVEATVDAEEEAEDSKVTKESDFEKVFQSLSQMYGLSNDDEPLPSTSAAAAAAAAAALAIKSPPRILNSNFKPKVEIEGLSSSDSSPSPPKRVSFKESPKRSSGVRKSSRTVPDKVVKKKSSSSSSSSSHKRSSKMPPKLELKKQIKSEKSPSEKSKSPAIRILNSELISHSSFLIKEINSSPESAADGSKQDAVSFLVEKQLKIKSEAEESYEKRKHRCQVCDKRFRGKSNLVDHLRFHANVRPFKCKYCDKTFVQAGSLKCHVRTHTQEKPYACQICQKAFNQPSSLKVHIRIHTNERNFVCDICSKRFMSTGDLSKHKRTHDAVKKFQCDICRKGFAQKCNLQKHMRLIHKEDGSPLKVETVEVA